MSGHSAAVTDGSPLPGEQERRDEGAEPTVNADAAKVLAEQAAKAFADENDRVKTLDTKAGLFFSATGAVIGLVAGTLLKLPDSVAKSPQATTVYLVLVCAGLFLFFLAELCFLAAVAPRTFQALVVEEWLEPGVARLPSAELHTYFARSYTEARRKSIDAAGPKLDRLGWGQGFLISGLLVLVVGVAPLVAWETYWDRYPVPASGTVQTGNIQRGENQGR